MTIDHTPGPWTIADPLEEGIEHANGVTIESPDGPVAVGVLEVDAAAIAALPDLVAALESILMLVESPIWGPQGQAMDRKIIATHARGAITKAGGAK